MTNDFLYREIHLQTLFILNSMSKTLRHKVGDKRRDMIHFCLSKNFNIRICLEIGTP